MGKFIRAVKALGPIDARTVARDGLLIMLLVIPVATALLYRFGADAVGVWLMQRWGVALEPYYPLLMSLLAVTPASLIGVMVGFMLLDERDEHTLTALRVTPLPFLTYLLYRLALPSVLGFVMVLITFPLAGLITIPWTDLVAVAGLAMLTAPITMLFLAAFASNKVVGLAMQKLLNGIQVLPMLAYFIDEPWQWAVGIIPTYWPLKLLWEAAAGRSYGLEALIGIGVNLAFLAGLALLFERKQQRVM